MYQTLGKNFHPPSTVTVESHSFSFTECSGSWHPHRTGALWAARSSSAGRPDPPSSQCFPAGGDLTSGRRPPRMTSGTTTTTKKNSASSCHARRTRASTDTRADYLPRCLRTRSTACWDCCRGSWHRRRCCCRRLHTRSRGNIAARKSEIIHMCFTRMQVTLGLYYWQPEVSEQ